MACWCARALLVVLLGATASVARAQQAPTATAAEGVEHARAAAAEGASWLAAGDYERALDAYQRAYLDNIDEPGYLASIADCYRGLHRTAEALRFYRLFLHERPGAPERDSIEAKIRALEEPAPPAPVTITPRSRTITPPSPPKREVWRRWWFWTALGGAVAAGVGLGVGLGTRSDGGNSSFMPTLPGFGAGSPPGAH